MVKVVGLDLSLTSTGIAYADGNTTAIRSKLKGDARLLELCSAIESAVHLVDYVVLEDLPTHAKSAGLTGRVQGVARWVLQGQKVPYLALPAATLKKFATGSGRADKNDMLDAMELACGVRPKYDDEADAWWLSQAGYSLLGEPAFGADHSALSKYADGWVRP